MSSAFIGAMWTDPTGRIHIRNPQITGGDYGISVGGDEAQGSGGVRISGNAIVDVQGGSIYENQVGVEALGESKTVLRGVSVENNEVADIAHNAESAQVQLADVYTSKLFELTRGQFSNIDSELNYVADRMLDSTGLESKQKWAGELLRIWKDTPEWLRGGAKWDLVKLAIKILLAS